MVQMDENGCGRRVDMLEDDVPVLMDPRQMEEEILPMEKKRQRVLLVERVVTGLFALAVVLWLIGDERRLGVEVGGTRRGVVASTLPVLCFGMLKFKDQMFTYPHPLFWRLVTSISLLYLMLIAYLSMQTTDDARKFMKYLEPVYAGKPLPEKSYSENCELTVRNVVDSFDVFIVAHTFGWFFKSILLRDRGLLWTASIAFELLEQTFRGLLPNFDECWWDRWILDVLVCNLMGIELGMLVNSLFNDPFYWSSIKLLKSTAEETTDGWKSSVAVYGRRWLLFENRERFCKFLFVLIIVQMVDINAFFLKAVLWVDVPSNLNIYRLLIIGCTGLTAVREFYQFTCDPICSGPGYHVYILTCTLLLELVIVAKGFVQTFPNASLSSFTTTVKAAWSIALPTCILFFLLCPSQSTYRNRKNKQQ